MIRAKPWNGKDLKGVWEFTLKIDGVRAFEKDGGWVSRNGKPLYNLPNPSSVSPVPKIEGFEVYCSKPGRSSKDNYKATIKCVRAKTKDRPIAASELYSLDPLDKRLSYGALFPDDGRRARHTPYTRTDPSAEIIREALKTAVSFGYEGLVLRQGDKWLKVKPVETYDVKVTGIIEGTGKHKGRMGALMTDMGKVGTGFTDADRETFWRTGGGGLPEILIEVECMQLTPAGKFRHPRFVRIRYDK